MPLSSNGEKMSTEFQQQVINQLPTGSDYEKVKSFLEANNIEYSWLGKDRVFLAIKRDLGSTIVTRKSLEIKIYMNSQNQVYLIEFQTIYTGL
jgi:hypothetical protein